MSSSPRREWATAATVGLCWLAFTGSASAQYSAGTGVEYQGYDFGAGLGANRAQLLLIPLAARLPVAERWSVDVYSGWAEGSVQAGGEELTLSGFVDTGIRAAYQVTPWGMITVGMNVPTGKSRHTTEEALVASTLSTALFGFKETTWGRGFAVTSSMAVAGSVSGFGLGVAASFAFRGKYKPTATDNPLTPGNESELEYRPGSERRIRVGLDRNFGNSTLTMGASFINYAEDQADGQNLFQAGNRFHFDASYAFRMGGGVWTLYAADLIRENGDLALPYLDSQGDTINVTTVQTPKQSLFVGGVMGYVPLGGGFVFRPHVDGRLQSRTNQEGSKSGSGWLVGLGGDVPIRVYGHDLFPKARVLLGKMKGPAERSVSVLGLEFSGTLRFNF